MVIFGGSSMYAESECQKLPKLSQAQCEIVIALRRQILLAKKDNLVIKQGLIYLLDYRIAEFAG
jgi:hypothetical protein